MPKDGHRRRLCSMCLGACCERLTTSEVAVRLQFLAMYRSVYEKECVLCEVSVEGVYE